MSENQSGENQSGEKRVRIPDDKFVVAWVKVANLKDGEGNRIGSFEKVADELGLKPTSVVQRQYAVNRKLSDGGFEKLPKMPTAGRQTVNISELAKLAGLKALAEIDEIDAEITES